MIKGVSETIKNEVKELKRGFLGMLLDTLGTSLLENPLTGKDTIRAGEGTIRAGQGFKSRYIILQILKRKSIMRMNLHLMMFIQEIFYLKKMGHM